MNSNKYIVCFVAALLLSGAGMYADDKVNSGWHVGGGAGITVSADGFKSGDPQFGVSVPAFQAYALKWFNPAFGVRFGIQGLQGSGFWGLPGYTAVAVPVDFMMDIPGLIYGAPHPGRFQSAAYLSGAYYMGGGKGTIGGGGGLFNTLSLGGGWSATLDLRAMVFGQRITAIPQPGVVALGSVAVGAQYSIDAARVPVPAATASPADARSSSSQVGTGTDVVPATGQTDVTSLYDQVAADIARQQQAVTGPYEHGNYTGGVKGTVVSRSTREPLEGAVVQLYYGAEMIASARSASDGTFMIPGIRDGMYSMMVVADDYLQNSVNVTVNDGYVKNMFNISMTGIQKVAEVDDDSFAQFDMDDSGYSDNPTILFGSNDVFNNIAGYNFSSVRFRARGYSSESQEVYLAGVKLNDAITGYSPFSLWSGLNEAMRSKETVNGSEVADFGFGGYNGMTNIFGNASNVRKGIRGSVLTNSTLYRLRLMGSYATGLMDNGWAFALNVSARLGGNDWIDGVYYRSFAYYLAADRVLDDAHKIGFVFFATPGERGAQNASTQEVYDLMGDNMYNSNWGYQNGKVRNARVRKTNEPVAFVKYDFTPDTEFSLSATVLYRFGKNGYTALDWYDAQDPRPDYYRNLPSYFFDKNTDLNRANFMKAAWAKEVWSNSSLYPELTHINWDRFYNVNRIQTDANGLNRSKYIQEERHVDQNDLNFALSFKDWHLDNLTWTGGAYARINRTEYYKVVADLLGGDYFKDIDNFAERDFAASRYKLQNDLDYYMSYGDERTLYEGDKYGYDYYAQMRSFGGWLNGRFTTGNLSVNFGGRYGRESFWREGLVRKGLFPGLDENGNKLVVDGQTIEPTYESDGSVVTSFGKSKVMSYNTYALKAGANLVIGGNMRVYGNIGSFCDAPKFNQAFLSPRTRNSVVDNLKPVKTFSADANWQYAASGINIRTTAYYTTIKDQSKVMSAYDDLQNAFSNFAITGIDQRNMGVELGFKVPTYIFPDISLQGVLSAGRYEYTSNPRVTQTVDNSAEVVLENVKVPYWKSTLLSDGTEIRHYVPSTPQIAASLGLAYNKNYWFIDADLEYFGESYLDMNPLYRTNTAVTGPDNIITDAEIEYMTAQERFSPALLLNFSVGKSWYIRWKYQLGFSLNVKNLLGNDLGDWLKSHIAPDSDITFGSAVKTGGYEQTRLIDNTVSKSQYYRFDPKYFYMSGTNYMLNVYFRF